jgi:cyclic nucleotide-binding protein
MNIHLLRSHIEKIIALSDEEFDFIASFFVEQSFKKHQFLVQEGILVTNEYWVAHGLLKASQIDLSGKEHILQFAMEDWWVTDYQAFFQQKEASLDVICLEDTKALAISYENKEKLCTELPKMSTFWRKKSNMGYAAQQRRILSLLSSDARTRYEQFLELYPSLLQRLPKSLIASYLGVSRETLSRLY